MYVLLVTVILFALRNPIATMFDAEGEMRALIYLFCGPLALLQFFNGAIFVCNASFNNLGHPLYSTVINWSRHTLGTWPFVIAGAAMLGSAGVLLGQAVGGIIFAAIGIVAAWKLTGRLRSEAEVDTFASETQLQQVTTRRNW